MTKRQVKKFVGKLVQVTWQDIACEGVWSDAIEKLTTESSRTVAWLVSMNRQGDVFLASSRNASREFGDRNTMPCAVITRIQELAIIDGTEVN
jgi:hypothetical protein